MSTTLPICYLNGAYLPLSEARVSPLDRAFLFGDAVYEVIPVYGGRPFRLREHLDRLNRSLAAIRMRGASFAPGMGRHLRAARGALRQGGLSYLYSGEPGSRARAQSRLA